jgi:hypothetical protein
MAITYNGSSSTDAGNVSSLSWSHDNSGDILVVGVAVTDVFDRTITGITYNGVALTYIFRRFQNNTYGSDLWYLLAPASGSHTIVVTWDAAISHDCVGTAISLSGAHQSSSVVGQLGTSTSTSSNISRALSSIEESSSWLVSHVCTQAAQPLVLDNETVRIVKQRGFGMWGGMNTLVPTSDPDTIGWHISGTNYMVMIAAEILAAEIAGGESTLAISKRRAAMSGLLGR